MELSIDKKEKIIEFLKNKYNIEFIYLFGSYAKKEAREDSDIDIGIVASEVIENYDLLIIASDLSFVLGKEVQIIDMQKASTVLNMQIFAYGIALYNKNEYFHDEYVMKTYSLYAKLNEEREVVLKNIKKNGSIYGQ